MAYTIRLDKKTNKQLQKIMEGLGLKSANKAFIKMIMDYEKDQEELKLLSKSLSDTTRELDELKHLLLEQEDIKSRINEILSD